jgi:hypothetical protein
MEIGKFCLLLEKGIVFKVEMMDFVIGYEMINIYYTFQIKKN